MGTELQWWRRFSTDFFFGADVLPLIMLTFWLRYVLMPKQFSPVTFLRRNVLAPVQCFTVRVWVSFYMTINEMFWLLKCLLSNYSADFPVGISNKIVINSTIFSFFHYCPAFNSIEISVKKSCTTICYCQYSVKT